MARCGAPAPAVSTVGIAICRDSTAPPSPGPPNGCFPDRRSIRSLGSLLGCGRGASGSLTTDILHAASAARKEHGHEAVHDSRD